jgi:arsenate reductase
LLKEKGVAHEYREYTEDPLSLAELKQVFKALGQSPKDLLRARDAKPLGVTGDESDAQLLKLMAEHPTLLQRPIGWKGTSAVVGRPIENLLDL